MVPTQSGPLLETVGTVGIAFTTTLVVAAALVQPLADVVTEYVPALAIAILLIVGF